MPFHPPSSINSLRAVVNKHQIAARNITRVPREHTANRATLHKALHRRGALAEVRVADGKVRDEAGDVRRGHRGAAEAAVGAGAGVGGRDDVLAGGEDVDAGAGVGEGGDGVADGRGADAEDGRGAGAADGRGGLRAGVGVGVASGDLRAGGR